jgi:hypothetical protein
LVVRGFILLTEVSINQKGSPVVRAKGQRFGSADPLGEVADRQGRGKAFPFLQGGFPSSNLVFLSFNFRFPLGK